jgi:hypothetical protein
MHDSSLSYRTAGDLAQLIRRREISPLELTQATLARIDRSQPVLNAFITVCHDQAPVAARAVEAAITRNEPIGPRPRPRGRRCRSCAAESRRRDPDRQDHHACS